MAAGNEPAGLGPRGAAFWREIAGDETIEATVAERELLAEACRLLDVLDGLQAAVQEHGTMVRGHAGQPRLNPAIGELRQYGLALAKILAILEIPDADGEPVVESFEVQRARKAANVRWGLDPRARGRRGA